MIVKADLFPDSILIVTSPQEAVMTYVYASIIMAFALTFPVFAYHLWAFLAPGLVADEKRLIAWVVLPSTLLFLAGMGFAYLILLPRALSFLIAAARPLAEPMLSMGQAFYFIGSIMAASGLLFQIPLVTAVASRLGSVGPTSLSHYRRHVILASFIVAAIITDPSPVTQVLLALPMILLYEAGIMSARLFGGKR